MGKYSKKQVEILRLLAMRPHAPEDLYQTLSLSEQQLLENVRPLIKDRFVCIDRGELRLLPEGEAYVEELVQKESSESSADNEDDRYGIKNTPENDQAKNPFYKSMVFWAAAGVIVTAIGVIITVLK